MRTFFLFLLLAGATCFTLVFAFSAREGYLTDVLTVLPPPLGIHGAKVGENHAASATDAALSPQSASVSTTLISWWQKFRCAIDFLVPGATPAYCLKENVPAPVVSPEPTFEPPLVLEPSSSPEPSFSPSFSPPPSSNGEGSPTYVTQNPTYYNTYTTTGGVSQSYVDALFTNLQNQLYGLALHESLQTDRIFDSIRRSNSNSNSNSSGSSGSSGTLTSLDASGGTTGLSFTGGPITSSGTLTLSGTLATTNGGTGTSSPPSQGQLLLGNATGGYDLVATSSLGVTSTEWSTNGNNIFNNNVGNVGIGTTSPFATLSIAGTANQTNPLLAMATTPTAEPFFTIASSTGFNLMGGVTQPTHAGKILNGVGGAALLSAQSVFVSGNYAYIASAAGTLEIVDISDPKNPVHKGSLANGVGGAALETPQSVFVSGNYAYVASRDSNALEIVDISNPSAPVHKGSLANGVGGAALSGPQSVFVSGNYAYVASQFNNALEIVDISNPSAPVHKG
ncbi:MAG: hypothetical protein ABI430_03870, partial [Candidatus Taylorbacteria bacterium]